MMQRRLPVWLGAMCLCVLLLGGRALAADVPAAGETVFERWYAVMLADQRAGWMHHRIADHGEQFVTTQRMEVSMARGQMVVTISIDSSFTETHAGKPVKATVTQKLSTFNTTTRMTFEGRHATVTTQQPGGRETTQRVDLGETDWLPPAAADRHVAKMLAAGEKQFSYKMVDPSVGAKVMTVTMKADGEQAIEVMGKVVPARVYLSTASVMPDMQGVEYVDEHGRMLRSAIDLMPGMSLEVLAADASIAQAKLDPPEIMASMLVKPDRAIDRPRTRRQAVYEIDIPKRAGADADATLIRSFGVQRIEWIADDTVRVTVDLDKPVVDENDKPGDAELAASVMIDAKDPRIKALVETALGDDDEKMPAGAKAERLRRFVSDYVQTRDFGVGQATATEVAQTRQGDCSEHAVLLAAMLRASDIPARTVIGLVYVEQFAGQRGVFGYHMWNQAWLDGRWVDLDATLGPNTPFDAAHIAFAPANLGEQELYTDLARVAPLMGGLKIRVVSVDGAR